MVSVGGLHSNYENGEIPTPAYGNLISAASEPQTFMHLLEKAKEHFSEKTFKKVKEKVALLIHSEDENKILYATLNLYRQPNNFTGYKITSSTRIANIISYFIQNSKPEFNDKLKINKQLFFADFTHYRNYGVSITGLSYRAIKYGPMPANYDNIYAYLENEQFISSQFSKLSNGGAGELFVSNTTVDTNIFSDEEKETFAKIIEKFANISTWEIVELSHKGKAWKALESNNSLISYQDYAFELGGL